MPDKGSNDNLLGSALGLAEFGPGDSWVSVNGNRYIATDGSKGVRGCTGGPRCAFAIGLGCELLLPSGGNTRCQSMRRADSRAIVWMAASATPGA